MSPPGLDDPRDSNIYKRIYYKFDKYFVKRNLSENIYKTIDKNHKYTIILN